MTVFGFQLVQDSKLYFTMINK